MYEQEIKLTANDETVLDEVLQSKLVRELDTGVGGRDAVHYLGVYYDTESRALADNFCSLRARKEGERWRAALKFGGTIENGLSRRQELEADISNWLDNAGQLPPGALRDKVAEMIPDMIRENAPLFPRVTVDMRRSIRNLEFQGTAIELVTDRGIIRGQSRAVELYEVELELMRGDIAAVVELGEMLTQRHALTPSTMTKHRIGLQLG